MNPWQNPKSYEAEPFSWAEKPGIWQTWAIPASLLGIVILVIGALVFL